MVVEGVVAPGFESVKQLYEHNMSTLAERNTQLCIYVGEECVVDLWASAIDDSSFSADSLVNVFSSGKSLEAITMAMLVDRGLLDYDARITDYWPEFGGNRAPDTTIADLMRHEAGMAAFDTTLEPAHLHPEGLKQNADGSYDIYFAPKPPKGYENNWLATVPGKGWFVGLRMYGPLEPWIEKTWRPGEIELVE